MKQKLIDLIKNIPLKKRAFLLHALEFLDINQVAYLTKIDYKIVEQVKTMLSSDVTKELLNKYSTANLNKMTSKKTKVSKSRFGNYAGYREDLQETVKSKTEANVGRYLSARYGRSSWEYEPSSFPLSIKTKTGRVKNYTPDFRIIFPDGDIYLEIKPGFLPQSRDKAKLKSFAKMYPDIKLVLVTYKSSSKVIDWATKNHFEIWFVEDMKEYCELRSIELE